MVTSLRIHQVIVSASDGDAITQMALQLQEKLSEFCSSEIFSFWNHSHVSRDRFSPLSELPNSSQIDLVVYHSSIGNSKVHETLMNLECPLVLMYHNITPSHFYRDTNSEFADQLDLGRLELQLLRPKVRCVVADSYYNARDVKQYGYERVEVIPAGFNPSRLCDELVDASTIREINDEFPRGFVLVVGQVLPHKRIEQAIETIHLLNSTYELGIGLVICGAQRQHIYSTALKQHMKSLPFVGVKMTGAVSDSQLATYYKSASVYLSMSAHEGLCIPPTEAMAMGTPVVAKGSGAIPETLGNGAVVLPEDAGPILASEAIFEIIKNQESRFSVQTRGRERVDELKNRNNDEQAARLLRDLVS